MSPRNSKHSPAGLPATTSLTGQTLRCKLEYMPKGVELILAGPEHQSALGKLLELYSHDFSEFVPLDVGEDGRYGYKNLPLYWSDNNRLPFLARLEGKLVGFALVARIPEPSGEGEAWDMAEFFVLRRCRHSGIGAELAQKVWLRCPGKWEIRVVEKNVSARKFWEASITRFTGQPAPSSQFMIDDVAWYRFSLHSSR